MKIKHQLLLTHGLLVLLSILIVFVNVATYKGMDNDAIIVNYAGKLRYLSYNMSQIVNRIENNNDLEIKNTLLENLNVRVNDFDNIIDMLIEKNDFDIQNKNKIEGLEQIEKDWRNKFKPGYLSIISEKSTTNMCNQINSEVDKFVSDINDMVTSYSVYSKEKVVNAMIMNAILILVIIIITIYSFITTNKRINKPIDTLIKEIKDLSLIDDEVSQRLQKIDSDEITKMSHYFNEMMFDELTKTFNRKSGLYKLSSLLRYNNREKIDLSLCFIDINGLKDVNDILGHEAGDELIISSVECIKSSIRSEDFIIRMGGDEFLIVFNGIGVDYAEKAWDRINNKYQEINNSENRPYIISVSHGIVENDKTQDSEIDTLIKIADNRMYEEKRYIKNDLKIKVIR